MSARHDRGRGLVEPLGPTGCSPLARRRASPSAQHKRRAALAGGVVALMLGCSTAAQLVLRRMPSLPAQSGGLGLLIAGLVGIIAATQTDSVTVVIVAAVLAGFGQSLAFGGALAEVNAVAPPERRDGLVSSFCVVIYLGVALPVIGSGVIALASGLLLAVQIFAYAAACLVGLVAQRIDARCLGRLTPPTECS